jgi:hypothetical protein
MLLQEDRDTGILGVPLSPEVLRTIGALKQFPPVHSGYRPDGDWEQSYRVFGCHGYVDTGNETVGLLKLRRSAGNPFLLSVEQRIQHNNGHETLEVKMSCRADAIASLVNWTLTSRRFDADGREIENLRTTEKRTNGSDRVTSDFSLFEAVQRLPFAAPPAGTFDILEGMALRRAGHKLYSSGERSFHHTGRGLLPYQYWLDESHRLLVVVTQWRAYILADNAETEQEQRRPRAGKKGDQQ